MKKKFFTNIFLVTLSLLFLWNNVYTETLNLDGIPAQNNPVGSTLSSGNIWVGDSGNRAASRAVSGDIAISNTGATTIQANSVALTTDTTGNYVATITGGSGISGTSAAEGGTPTIALSNLTADWTQAGAYDLILNNASSELKILESTGATYYSIFDVGDLSADQTFTFNVGGTVYTTGNDPLDTIAEWQSLCTSCVDLTADVTGTLPVTNGGTGLSSTTANQILYSSATNTIAGLSTVNSGLLVTSGAGVPSISTDIPTAATIGSAYVYRASGTDVTVADGGTGTSTGSITGTSALTFTAGGTNQNVTLTPSGTGYTLLNGNVGIGTTNPADGKLVIHSTTGNISPYITTDDNSNAYIGFGTDRDGTPRWGHVGMDYSQNVIKMTYGGSFEDVTLGILVNSSGSVGIGDATPTEAKLVVGDAGVGDIFATFATANTETLCWDASGASLITDCTSLKKFKENIIDLKMNGIDTIMKLKPREFDWKGKEEGIRHDLGFIAEEVNKVNPLLASYSIRNEKTKKPELNGVKYERMVALLTKAMQEQQVIIVNLQKQVEVLQIKVNKTVVK